MLASERAVGRLVDLVIDVGRKLDPAVAAGRIFIFAAELGEARFERAAVGDLVDQPGGQRGPRHVAARRIDRAGHVR